MIQLIDIENLSEGILQRLGIHTRLFGILEVSHRRQPCRSEFVFAHGSIFRRGKISDVLLFILILAYGRLNTCFHGCFGNFSVLQYHIACPQDERAQDKEKEGTEYGTLLFTWNLNVFGIDENLFFLILFAVHNLSPHLKVST